MSRHFLQGIGGHLSSYNHGSVERRESGKDQANNNSSQEQEQQERPYNTIQVHKRQNFRKQVQEPPHNSRSAQKKNIFARGRFVSSAELEDASSSSSYGTERSEFIHGKSQPDSGSLAEISGARVNNSGNTVGKAYDAEQTNADTSRYSAVSTNTTSTGKVADAIIRRSTDSAEDCDYKIFNTSRPMRLSKVRALEEAEVTSKLYFRQKQDDLYEGSEVSNEEATFQGREQIPKVAYVKTRHKLAHGSKELTVSTGRLWKRKRKSWFSGDRERKEMANNNADGLDEGNGQETETNMETYEKQSPEEKAEADILVQLPELSKAETRRLMQQDCVDMDLENYYMNDDIDERDWPFPQTEAQKRLNAMKRALKPLNEEEMVEQRLRRSRLPKVFQNTGEFLSRLSLRELEYWEMMNEQFDDEMDSMISGKDGISGNGPADDNQENSMESREARVTQKKEQKLDFIDVPFDALYGLHIDHDMTSAVTADLRRRIKEDIQFDDEVLDLKLQDD